MDDARNLLRDFLDEMEKEETLLLSKLSAGYDMKALDVEELVTDSGKELRLQGNVLRRRIL